MASFRCYDNSDVIATLIMANFHLYLIQLWWQFFQMFVYGDVVYAQTWQVLTLKNCIEALSYASTAYVQGHPTTIFGKYLFGRRFEIYNFRNICCKISCLPASPRIFEHLNNGIIAYF